MSLNKIMLIGYLGKDPEVRVIEANQSKVATFSIATTERSYTLKNGTQVPERTEWHNIVAWNGIAETVEKYLHKGDKVYVEGKVRSRSYEDSQKITRYITEVFVDQMEMLTPKPAQPQTNIPLQQYPPQQAPTQGYQQYPSQQYPPQQQGTVAPWDEPHNQPQQGRFPWEQK